MGEGKLTTASILLLMQRRERTGNKRGNPEYSEWVRQQVFGSIRYIKLKNLQQTIKYSF